MVVGVLQGLRNARERAMYSNTQWGLQVPVSEKSYLLPGPLERELLH